MLDAKYIDWDFFPKTMLGMGPAWSHYFNLQREFISIGTPWRKRARSKNMDSKVRVLFLGDGIDTDLYYQFLASARDMMSKTKSNKNFIFSLRLHPSEVGLWDREPSILSHQADVWDDLAISSVVVGTVSTVLYQADDIGCRSIILNLGRGKYAYERGEEPFEAVSNPEELVNLLKRHSNDRQKKFQTGRDSFFSNWSSEAITAGGNDYV